MTWLNCEKQVNKGSISDLSSIESPSPLAQLTYNPIFTKTCCCFKRRQEKTRQSTLMVSQLESTKWVSGVHPPAQSSNHSPWVFRSAVIKTYHLLNGLFNVNRLKPKKSNSIDKIPINRGVNKFSHKS